MVTSDAAVIESDTEKTIIEYCKNVIISIAADQKISGTRAITIAKGNEQPRYILVENPIAHTSESILRSKKIFFDTLQERIHAIKEARLQYKTVTGRYTISANNIILSPNNMQCVAHGSPKNPAVTHICISKRSE